MRYRVQHTDVLQHSPFELHAKTIQTIHSSYCAFAGRGCPCEPPWPPFNSPSYKYLKRNELLTNELAKLKQKSDLTTYKFNSQFILLWRLSFTPSKSLFFIPPHF